MIYYPQEIGRNMDEIVRAVKAIKMSDENKVAMPADWPNNDLIGDKVIIPPPTDVEGAKKRSCEFDNYDWWFSYKSL
jgi:peroxiredoxin (alkyl hydroperoxide reductase subunit C)